MERWLTRVLALGVIGVVALLVVKSLPPPAPSRTAADAAADAATDASTPIDAATAAKEDAGLLLADLKELDLPADAGLALPSGSPRQVRLGIVLVTFAGAQGAPASARTKAAAREIADKLAADAQTDFHGAVQRGDTGSSDDIGRVPRGVLEPQTEVSVFTLSPGTVSGVIETPRGFWIVKRID